MAIISIEDLPNADPFPLGARNKWNTEDVSLLLRNGAFLIDHKLFIDQKKLSGTVPLGLTERRPGHLIIKGRDIRIRYGISKSIE